MQSQDTGITRRAAIQWCSAAAAIGIVSRASLGTIWDADDVAEDLSPLPISLAQWSLHRAINAKEFDPLEFARVTAQEYGLNAVEYVSTFYRGKAEDDGYLAKLKDMADSHGVTSLLIMVDGEGQLGNPDPVARKQAVKNHYKWIHAAKVLGCHAIRVNAASQGTRTEQMHRAADGLRQLAEYGATQKISVIVENHGGLSSDGSWLAAVMREVNNPNCGTLPDFGNFQMSEGVWYDRYKGVKELMPYAKAVSAKSRAFDADGQETTTDYARMMKIVRNAGYNGYVGIEYEGGQVSEKEGILKTKKLLETVGCVAVAPQMPASSANSE